jgi:hypothetical protein
VAGLVPQGSKSDGKWNTKEHLSPTVTANTWPSSG